MLKALLLILTFSVSSVFAEYITISSFNIAELGTSTPDKDHRAIADMIDEFDLIVVQEVQDKDDGGANHIAAIVDTLNLSAPSPYSYFVIPGAGRGYPGNEGYAYIYRSPVVLDESYIPAYGLKDTEVDYGRVPGWAYFRAGNFDFMIVTVHLHWSDLDKRTAGVADLLAWLKVFADRPETEERDLIVAGDTNRFGDYSNTKINNGETAFHKLLLDSDLDTKFRLLFCEYLTFPDAKEAPDDVGSTTVSDNNNMVYDQIIISAGVFNEFGDEKVSLGDNIGIIDYDNWPEFSELESGDIKDLVSDHRPIWAKFRIDQADDDGITTGIDDSTPSKFQLLKNYPNPFNPTTTIQYSIPRDGHVSLTVYNVSGQVINVLNDKYTQAGIHSVLWDARDNPSGLFFCTLKANGMSETRKMLLLK
ncbi:T9SS type A sorting domain-containing protein [Candidatus Omnitrophota bacterium]